MKIKNLVCFIIVITAFIVLTYAQAEDLNKEIFVSDAWVQAMPPSQTTTAAYMTIRNNSQKEVILSSASTDIAGATEIHQMSETNGMMRMAMSSNLHIPALGKIMLQPGGYHIMLINLKKPVNKGDRVQITLHFQDGGSIMVNAQVKTQPEDMSSGMKM